jgi:hypothetical protein
MEAVLQAREEVFMEGPLEPNMGPSLADVLLCTFESTNVKEEKKLYLNQTAWSHLE